MLDMALSRSSLRVLIAQLIAGELQNSRHMDSHDLDPFSWADDTAIGSSSERDPSLDADSMERIAIAEAVARFFNVYESGLEDYLLRASTLGDCVDVVVEARARGSQAITFTTSGSTGSPVPCDHSWASLVGEVAFFAAKFHEVANDPIRRVVAIAPPHHIYGFIFSVLLPEYLGVPVERGAQALSVAQRRHLRPGDAIVTHPFIWGRLAASGRAFPSGVIGLTSTAPSDPVTLSRLEELNLSTMVEIYGSSETAGIGFRTVSGDAFELLPRWRRAPEGAANHLVERGTGEVWTLSDHLEWLGQRAFKPAGRIDRAVQVGGVNVYPGRIAEHLEALPGVKSAAVRPMKPCEGDRLKAFVVPESSQRCNDALSQEIHRWCATNLSAPERPRTLTFGSKLPVNSMNKPGDWDV